MAGEGRSSAVPGATATRDPDASTVTMPGADELSLSCLQLFLGALTRVNAPQSRPNELSTFIREARPPCRRLNREGRVRRACRGALERLDSEARDEDTGSGLFDPSAEAVRFLDHRIEQVAQIVTPYLESTRRLHGTLRAEHCLTELHESAEHVRRPALDVVVRQYAGI